jgi:hypothetical protein
MRFMEALTGCLRQGGDLLIEHGEFRLLGRRERLEMPGMMLSQEGVDHGREPCLLAVLRFQGHVGIIRLP